MTDDAAKGWIGLLVVVAVVLVLVSIWTASVALAGKALMSAGVFLVIAGAIFKAGR